MIFFSEVSERASRVFSSPSTYIILEMSLSSQPNRTNYRERKHTLGKHKVSEQNQSDCAETQKKPRTEDKDSQL